MPKSKTDFTNFIDARPNYFAGQFLLEDDFEVEQKYLIDRQKYHRQSLHVSGIIEGLEVEVIRDKQEVQIKSGSAINSNGDLIVLKKDTSFSQFATDGELYISYKEEQQIKQQESFTRWQEVSTIGFAAKTPNDSVTLAKISIVNNVPSLDLTVRSYSGIFLPNAIGNDLTLRSGGNANPNVAILNGSLTVTGTITGNIDATSINSGTLDVARIPNLSAAKITSGTLTIDRIPNLSADKITSGTLTVDRIPNLSANKITTGTLNGSLSISGSSGTLLQVGIATGSTANIDLSGHVQLKEYSTDNLAYLQARDDTSNRNIGLRIRTQKQVATKREVIEALTISPDGNLGIGTITPSTKLEVNGDLKVTGKITTESWQTPLLQNGWVKYDDTYNPPGYFKDSFGIVHLRGLVRGGAGTIFTLPEGYRPAFRELQAVQTKENTIGRLDISTEGQVIMQNGNNGWFSLDGATFRAAL